MYAVNFNPAGDMGETYGGVTDYMGYYQFGVRYGVYDVNAFLPGFMTARHDVEVHSHGVYVDLTLVPCGVVTVRLKDS